MRPNSRFPHVARCALAGALALGLSSCAETAARPPPSDRFYFPTAIAHVDVPGKAEGTLYVASANADRCYDLGSVRALSLDALPVALPALGTPVAETGPVSIEDLGSGDPSLHRKIQSFAGEIGTWAMPDGNVRMLIPTRAEGGLLQILDASGPELSSLSCVSPSGAATSGDDCTLDAVSLEEAPPDAESDSVPRAPAPYGVSVAPDGQAFVTHTQFADEPKGSRVNPRGYVIRMDAADPQVRNDDYLQIPSGGTQSVAIGERYAFVSTRDVGALSPVVTYLDTVFAVPRDRNDTVLHSFPLQLQFATISTRGIALSPDERALYLVARSKDPVQTGGNPDVLIVASLSGARSSSPDLRVSRVVPLPSLPSSIKLVQRTGGSELLFIVAEGAGSLVIYDTAIGQVVAEVKGVGVQPAQLAVDTRTGTLEGQPVEQARIFVSNFGDGRIAVVDVPNLARPEDARVVAHIGRRQDDVQGQQSNTCKMGDE